MAEDLHTLPLFLILYEPMDRSDIQYLDYSYLKLDSPVRAIIDKLYNEERFIELPQTVPPKFKYSNIKY